MLEQKTVAMALLVLLRKYRSLLSRVARRKM